jgi:hypothetical protein
MLTDKPPYGSMIGGIGIPRIGSIVLNCTGNNEIQKGRNYNMPFPGRGRNVVMCILIIKLLHFGPSSAVLVRMVSSGVYPFQI